METYAFSIIASGIDPNAEDFENAFFAAGCDDATIAYQRGVLVLDFAREGRSFSHAIVSALSDVRKVGATVERIEPDPLVSLSEIAKRTGLTKAAISNYAHGHREEMFPGPVARVTTDSPLWDWVEVARWLRRRDKMVLSRRELINARVVRDLNLMIAEGRAKPNLKSRSLTPA
ncbi:MAG: helix-turn-helix transcriptional regulator [Hyphomicrobiaceae bacterium]